MLYRFMMAFGALLFTLEHPNLIAFSAIIYFFTQVITIEEKEVMIKTVSKGSIWLRELNSFVRKKGYSMKEGREVVSNVATSFFNGLEKEYLDELNSNEELQDKLNKFVVQYVLDKNKPVEEDEWEKWAFPLQDDEDMNPYHKEFIELLAPNFDWSKNYTRKAHRELSKTLKAKFRNSDGSLSDELGNDAVIYILQTLELNRGDIPEETIYNSTTYEFIKAYVAKNSNKEEFTQYLDELEEEEEETDSYEEE